jgi:hypothetical protein
MDGYSSRPTDRSRPHSSARVATCSRSLRHTIGAIDHWIYEKSTPKSHRARVIDLDADTVAALRSWRTRQAEERLLLGPAYDDRRLVFCHPDGRPYHPDRFSREFDRRIARHGVPRSDCTTSATRGRR